MKDYEEIACTDEFLLKEKLHGALRYERTFFNENGYKVEQPLLKVTIGYSFPFYMDEDILKRMIAFLHNGVS